uniref:Uncharacterized protein n=1 Tax=Anopheles atroparvus TaxID=41427 RepID=A0A182IMG9_ANOAO
MSSFDIRSSFSSFSIRLPLSSVECASKLLLSESRSIPPTAPPSGELSSNFFNRVISADNQFTCEPPLLLEGEGFGTTPSPAVPLAAVTVAIASPEEDDEQDCCGFDGRCPPAVTLLLPLPLVPGSEVPPTTAPGSLPKGTVGADVGVPRSGASNGLVAGLALSSDRMGRNGRPPLLPVLDAAVLLTDSASCLRDALILSGLRGGGSGGSEAAAIVTGPAVPFNCIPTRRSKEFTVSSLMAVWNESGRGSVSGKRATAKNFRRNDRRLLCLISLRAQP